MSVSLAGHLMMEDDVLEEEDCEVASAVEPVEVDKIDVELTVGLADSTNDWLLVAPAAAKGSAEGSRIAESLESKVFSGWPPAQQSPMNVHVFLVSPRCRDSNRQTYSDGYCNSNNAHQNHQNPRSKA